MPVLSLSSLEAHPHNANRMPAELMEKLAAHIRATGDYPPLIVRQHPVSPDRFQILDGHHRAQRAERFGTADACKGLRLVQHARLAGHSMFQGAAAERLKMCGDCRVIDMHTNPNEVKITEL